MINFYKIYIKIKSFSIKDKKTRQRFRRIFLQKKVSEIIKKTKFGVSYSVFDGEELLEASIRQIRNSVDYINVVWQSRSWYNTPSDENLYPFLKKLLDNGLIDELIEYTPDFSYAPGKNERLKRNLGLKYAKKAKVQYFMTMDTDEFYITEELEAAKRYIILNNITHSFCGIVRYGFAPDEIFIRNECNVQFLSKIKWYSILKSNKNIIAIVDPTRILNHYCSAKYFFLHNVKMHHMSSIRKNLTGKYQNSSNRKYWNQHNIATQHKEMQENTAKYKDVFDLKNKINFLQ